MYTKRLSRRVLESVRGVLFSLSKTLCLTYSTCASTISLQLRINVKKWKGQDIHDMSPVVIKKGRKGLKCGKVNNYRG